MRQGRISAGNGRQLAVALRDEDKRALSNAVDNLRREAADRSIQTVLVSSEWLLTALGWPGKVSDLLEAFSGLGAERIEFLLMLREPVSQCLSLYKHRAKSGTVGDIAEWCTDGYTTPEELKRFRLQAENTGINIAVRRYDTRPGMLERIFFEDWLGVAVPRTSIPGSVNPSLSLSELFLLRKVAEARPALVPIVYESLISVCIEDKVQGAVLEDYARTVAMQAVSREAEEWAAWNALLPADEKLSIPPMPASIPAMPRELGLTEAQMQALAALLADTATLRSVGHLFWHSRLRPVLGRLKRTVWNPA